MLGCLISHVSNSHSVLLSFREADGASCGEDEEDDGEEENRDVRRGKVSSCVRKRPRSTRCKCCNFQKNARSDARGRSRVVEEGVACVGRGREDG